MKRPRLAPVVIILVSTTILAFVTLKKDPLQQKLNDPSLIQTLAESTAKSLLQSAITQLEQRWETQFFFASDELSIYNQPLTITGTFPGLSARSPINLSKLEITGGTIPSTYWSYIDPHNPNNALDPQKGLFTYIRNVPLFAKVVADLPNGNEMTTFAVQILQVRDTPLSLYPTFSNRTQELSVQLVGYPNHAKTPPIRNNPYALIEPNLFVSDSNYKGEGELAKFSRKAGLIIRLHEKNQAPPSHAHSLSANYSISFNKLYRLNNNPKLDASGDVQEIPILADATFVSKLINMREYAEHPSSGYPTSGFYDQYQNQAMDALEISIDQLRTAIDDTHSDFNPFAWILNYNPQEDYNGVIYIEFPKDSGMSGRSDKITVSKNNVALLLSHASKVPNPTYNQVPERHTGFTVATNSLLYTLGNFNADGNLHTGTLNNPDNAHNPEPPCALAADTITLLSENWNPMDSKKIASRRHAQSTEICAALLAGSHCTANPYPFPKLLEDWSHTTLRIRGSMACLYECEIGSPFMPPGPTYKSPKTEFGHYSEFLLGKYPPAIPMIRTFHSLSFHLLSENEYNELRF